MSCFDTNYDFAAWFNEKMDIRSFRAPITTYGFEQTVIDLKKEFVRDWYYAEGESNEHASNADASISIEEVKAFLEEKLASETEIECYAKLCQWVKENKK